MIETTSSSQKTAILIHGLSEARHVWSRQQAFLEQSMRVIAYDVRGFGTSPVGAANGTVAQMADDLGQILSAENTGPVWLIGFSMGGVIAQRFALDFPTQTSGLILIASSCTVGQAGQEFFRDRMAQVSSGGLETLAAINEHDARGCFSLGDEKLIAEYQKLRVDAVKDAEGYLNAGRAMARLAEEPIVQDLDRIDCPTLVIAGETDPYCPPRASEKIAGAIPGSILEVVPKAGHCLHWEASDATNNLIHDFLIKHP
ncbi:MAG: alpha/beta hydrolase [Gammaproteobacteria bacterium]|nr:alpha/beta hydrolase [Gammaproteobacteria bacterium]